MHNSYYDKNNLIAKNVTQLL